MTFFEPQSGVEMDKAIVPESQGTAEPSAPLQTMSSTLGPGEQDITDINKVFTGESIASFRTLLKRGMLHESILMENQRGITAGIRCMFPFLRGFAPDAVHTTAAATDYNYCNTVLLHWVRYAFQGHRGSIRWRILPRFHVSSNNDFTVYTGRNPIGVGLEYANYRTTTTTALSESETAFNSVQNGLAGASTAVFPAMALDGCVFNTDKVNNVADIEVPWYSPFRFSPGKIASFTGIETFDPTWRFSINASSVNPSHADLWCSTGEDFQVYMWTGLPRLYRESSVPAAAGP
jgi:hypothetical protein